MRKILVALVGLMFIVESAFAAVTISTTSKTFQKAGGAASITISGDGAWTATSDVSWLVLSPTSGTGAGRCLYTCNANNTADTRIGHIKIGGNTYTVTQYGYDATLSPTTATFDRKGGTGTVAITVDAGVAWTAKSNDSWLSVEPASGMSVGTVTYTVAEYPGVTTRVGSLTVAGKTFTVTQNGVDVNIDPEIVRKDSNANIISVSITALAQTKWTITPNNSWISVVEKETGYGDYVATLAINANPSFERRYGTVSIGTMTLAIEQDGLPAASLAIDPPEATAAATGAYGNIAVYATPDAPWRAESLASWITISEGQSGAGNGNIKYVASANPTLQPREGQIRITPPYKTPDVDFYRGLVCEIAEQQNTEGNESRSFEYPLSKAFDGSFKNLLTGTVFPKKSDNEFSLFFTFSLTELNRINRLLQISWLNLYVNEENELVLQEPDTKSTWKVTETGKTYACLVRRNSASDSVQVYAGALGEELALMATRPMRGASVLNFASSVNPNEIKLGYTTMPTTGNLTGGTIGNFRFWTRALTDNECRLADVGRNGKIPSSSQPRGNIRATGWDHYTLDEHGYHCSPRDLMDAKNENTSLTDWQDSLDRFGLSHRAVKSTGAGRITISNFENMFDGQTVLQDITKGPYRKEESRTTTSSGITTTTYTQYPFPATATADSEVNATYAFWLRVASKAQFDVTIFSRSLSENVGAGGLSAGPNEELSLTLKQNGNLELSGSGVTTRVFERGIFDDAWHQIVVVGTSGTSIQMYLDGVEIGNVQTDMTLGFLPKIDKRYNVTTRKSGSGISSTTSSQWYGSVAPCRATFTLGGWNGSVDELTFYHAALTSAQVRQIYEAQRANIVYHTVKQGKQSPMLDRKQDVAPAKGATGSVNLTLAQLVNWSAQSNMSWIKLTGNTSGAGSARIDYEVEPNPTVTARRGTITIAGLTFVVTQEGLWADVSSEDTSFGVDSGSGFLWVDTEGAGQWTAKSDVNWITIWPGYESGNGAGPVMFIVDDYSTTTQSRTGTITVAGKKVVITQQGYELSIDPMIADIGSNAGAGQFGVAAPIDAVWEAIADCDWITIIGSRTGIGDGTIQYTVKDNLTGETRTGRIVVGGKIYTITQRTTLPVSTQVVGKGKIVGAGNYNQGTKVTLKATPDAGYVFSHWSGDAVGNDDSVEITVDIEKNVTATFIPEAAAQVLAEKKAAQGGFYTRDQIHALELGNLVLDVDASGTARIGVQLMESSDLSNWQAVDMSAGSLDVGSDGSVGMNVKASGNAKFYKVVVPEK